MAGLALTLVSVFLIVVFPLRSWRRRARFGAAGRADYRHGRPGSWKRADALFLLGFALVLTGPGLAAVELIDVIAQPSPATIVLGMTVMALAVALAVWAQNTMGAAWRPDIAPADDCQVVTDGPFRVVRNPTYVAMLAAAAGAALLAPTVVGIVGWLALLTSLVLTTRAEEPPLRRAYGTDYEQYAARVGRFLPLIGRLRNPAADAGDS